MVGQIERNSQDRAARILQHEWSIEYTRYVAVGTDVLPAQLTLRRDNARVGFPAPLPGRVDFVGRFRGCYPRLISGKASGLLRSDSVFS